MANDEATRGRHRARCGSTSGRSGCWPTRSGCGWWAPCVLKRPGHRHRPSPNCSAPTPAPPATTCGSSPRSGWSARIPTGASGGSASWQAAHDVTRLDADRLRRRPRRTRPPSEWIQGDQVRLLGRDAPSAWVESPVTRDPPDLAGRASAYERHLHRASAPARLEALIGGALARSLERYHARGRVRPRRRRPAVPSRYRCAWRLTRCVEGRHERADRTSGSAALPHRCYGLRWLPTRPDDPGDDPADAGARPRRLPPDRPGRHAQGLRRARRWSCPPAGSPTRSAAEPVLLAAGRAQPRFAGAVRGGATRSGCSSWSGPLQGVYRALDSGPLESWYVDATLAADPEAEYERGLGSRGTVVGGGRSAPARCSAGGLIALGPIGPVTALTVPVLAAIARRRRRSSRLLVLLVEERPATGVAALRASVGPARCRHDRPGLRAAAPLPGRCWRWWPSSCSGASAWSPSSRCCRSDSPR